MASGGVLALYDVSRRLLCELVMPPFKKCVRWMSRSSWRLVRVGAVIPCAIFCFGLAPTLVVSLYMMIFLHVWVHFLWKHIKQRISQFLAFISH